jgi:hypothetical protein
MPQPRPHHDSAPIGTQRTRRIPATPYVIGAALVFVTAACGAAGAPKQAAAPSMPSSAFTEESTPMPASASAGQEEIVVTGSTIDHAPLSTSSSGGGGGGQAPVAVQVVPGNQPVQSPPPAADVSPAAQAILAKKHLVIEGWLALEVERVDETTARIRAQVESMGGRVMDEQISGDSASRYGSIRVKLPPGETDGFVGWIEKLGDLRSKRIQSTDVSRQLFDQVIALENTQRTLDRLRALLDRQGLSMQEILSIEQEMTRLRGEIERIKGEKRFLEHQVAQATITIEIRQRPDAVLLLGEKAEPKLYPGPRVSMLYLLDAGDRTNMRLGVGAAVHIVSRVNLELDIFNDPDDTGKNAALATFGGDIYSDLLGRGRRSFLNPYLGLRLGFGYLDRATFAFAAGGGVELFKHEYVLVDLNVRAVGLAGRGGFDTAVVTGGALVFAF